jgi:predicted flap endonuclease-1-like 5' DNA nuclease
MGGLTEGMTGLRNEIEALRNKREGFIAHLGQGVAELRSGVDELKEGFRKDRSEMAGIMKADLRGFLAEIGEYVTKLKDDVVDMQGGFRKEHAVTSRNTKAERKLFLSEVKHSVAVLKQEIADLLEGIADDLGGARRAWSGSSLADGRSKTPKRKAAVQDNLRKEPGKQVAELFPDDFTKIPGIGPGRSKLLNDAGIFTFAQLAGRTPGKLEQVVGRSAKGADLEEWINRAKEYSR